MVWKGERISLLTDLWGNGPFGFRPEPGAHRFAPTLPLPPGEVPEGRARVAQDTDHTSSERKRELRKEA